MILRDHNPYQIQEAQYNVAAARLTWMLKFKGRVRVPDAAPKIEISEPGGTVRVAATNMTVIAVDTAGGNSILDYDGGSVPFVNGALLTGATSKATATIERVEGTEITGALYLSNQFGTFSNDEVITDDSEDTGAAVANQASYTTGYRYDLDTTPVANFGISENYFGLITYDVNSIAQRKTLYFDVVRQPFTEPIVTSEYIDSLHPDWKRLHPLGDDATWDAPIAVGHGELARRIRLLGNRPSMMVRTEELLPYELAFVRHQIALFCGFKEEDKEFWDSEATNAWASRGEFQYDTNKTPQIDGGVVVLNSGWRR